MKKSLFIIFFILNTMLLNAQDKGLYLDLVRAESELASMYDSLYNPEFNIDRLSLFNAIDSTFKVALELPGSMDFPWTKLDKIGKLESDDGKLKVFSWLLVVNREDYRYTSYLQIREKKEGNIVIKLMPSDDQNVKKSDFMQKVERWHAKIYYDLITTEYKRKKYYTLIGADFNDTKTAIKTIEVLQFKRNTPYFQKECFLDEGTVRHRMIMEYSADLAASVRYNKELKLIVFDHLAPLHPLYHGVYQFYGPDGSYDALRFVDGIWVRENDVDARND